MLKTAQTLVFPKNETWERKRASMAVHKIKFNILFSDKVIQKQANAFCYAKQSKILVEPVKF